MAWWCRGDRAGESTYKPYIPTHQPPDIGHVPNFNQVIISLLQCKNLPETANPEQVLCFEEKHCKYSDIRTQTDTQMPHKSNWSNCHHKIGAQGVTESYKGKGSQRKLFVWEFFYSCILTVQPWIWVEARLLLKTELKDGVAQVVIMNTSQTTGITYLTFASWVWRLKV